MPKIGEAWIEITARTQKLRDALGRARLRIGAFVSSMITKVKRMAKIFAVAFVALGVTLIKFASDAEESENLFTESMGDMAKSTRKWSNELSKALGLNAFEIRKMVSTFNIMLKSMGIGGEKAAEMSKGLTLLANDMASFFNLKPEEAFQKLQSGITGEVEPLKRLGIIVNETTTKTHALTLGMVEQGEALTETQKILARYSLIMKQTTAAQGDLARTQGAFANTWRRLKSQIVETAIAIGTVFLPDVTKATGKLADFVNKSREKMVAWVVDMREGIAKWIEKMGGAEGIVNRIKAAFATLVSVFKNNVLPALKAIAEVFKGIVSGIEKIGGLSKFSPILSIKKIVTLSKVIKLARESPPGANFGPRPANFVGPPTKLEQLLEEHTSLFREIVRNTRRDGI